ncbi:MAG TPA: M20/M25/M40 family metallo-hydrolase [Armatimonadota bacterium]|nr:M20/M25/M40 family metallo-hydrolase [Armatimonadota bacterium]
MDIHAVDRQRLLDTFLTLLRINSPSRHEGAMAKHVMALLQDVGAEVTVDDSAERVSGEIGNIIARIPGTIAGEPLLFCSHIDTVAPTDQLTIRQQDGVITSDGTTILGADDKAGVAAIIEMLQILKENNIAHPSLIIVFTVAEEIGVMGSMVLDYDQVPARYGFVPDSSGQVGTIITNAPAQKHLKVRIVGKAAHAGMAPEQGISAITIAARAIANMHQGRIDEETTANIGVINGGKATNIVPESVEIEGEARSRDPKKLDALVEHMRSCFTDAAEQAGGRAYVEVSDVYPGFSLREESPAVQYAKKALARLGKSPVVTSTGGGSDANFLNNHGIETAILSAGYHHPHGTNEKIDEESLIELTAWMLNIIDIAGQG